MAGLSQQERDLDAVAEGLRRWFVEHRPDAIGIGLSPFRTNPTSGYSSETLLFELHAERHGSPHSEALVVRLPPAGGGMFPSYDLGRQALVQDLLASHGVPAPTPSEFEPDAGWIGTPFLVMPQVPGRIPGDYTYLLKGWMKDAMPARQQACYESYVDALVTLHTLDVGDVASSLARPDGVGLAAEAAWWRSYFEWASDDDPHPHMAAAYEWMAATLPTNDALALTWGDPRFANAAFDEDGHVVGALDWEQAAVGPPELDVGWFFTCRRQVRDAFGIAEDPELPGFLDRAATIARIEDGLGRALLDLEWHETFAAVRMGTCVVGIQRVLRHTGRTDHYLMAAPPLPDWVLTDIAA